MTRTIATLLTSVLAFSAARSAEPFRLADGDRVVLIGGTLVEREQKYGYWEAALTTRFPGVTFRNLGWSGDTVFGEARASFDHNRPGVALTRLVGHTLSLKPTVLFVGYGANESFEGEAGLPKFVNGLEALLDALAPSKARVVLMAPPGHEDLGRPLPDPAAQNRNLRLYGDAIRAVARKRGHGFVNLYELFAEAGKAAPLTDNGMHLTAYGYWRSAEALERGLGWEPPAWRVGIDGAKASAEGAKVTDPREGPLRFDVTDDLLPTAPPPGGTTRPEGRRVLRVAGLAEGSYTLSIDGKPAATAAAAGWAKGVSLSSGPEFGQAEQLRSAIVEKNHQYFHRWRPQNETYLFGFRKHEQGRNAREIPLFDPIVAEKEKEIARLRVPAACRYELTRPRG